MKTFKLCKSLFFIFILISVFTSCFNNGDNSDNPYAYYSGPVLVTNHNGMTMLKDPANNLFYSTQLETADPPLPQGTPATVVLSFYHNQQVSSDYLVGVINYWNTHPLRYPVKKDDIDDDFNEPIGFKSDIQTDSDFMKIDDIWFIYFYANYRNDQVMDFELIYLPESDNENKFTFYFKTKIETEGSGALRTEQTGVSIDLTNFIMTEGIGKGREELRYDFKYAYDVGSNGNLIYRTLLTDKILWKK